MRNDNNMTPKLYGVGIGPGDPKLLTLKAKEALEAAEVIFAPKGNEEGISVARKIIEQVIEGEKTYIELIFPMTKDKDVLKKYWKKAGQRIAGELRKGKQAAFVTLGDPFIYSTYIYLLKILKEDFPGIEVETIPGISAFNAAASRAGFPLLEGKERMAVLPVSETLDGIEAALDAFDTVVLMKVGRNLQKVIRLLKQKGLAQSAVLISRAGHPDEKVIRDIGSIKDKETGYLSVILVKSPRPRLRIRK